MPRNAPSARRSSSMLPFYIILGLVALGGAFFLFRQASGGGGAPATTLEKVALTPEQMQSVAGISKGSPNAPVVMLEFADFQCPGCGQFATFSEPLMQDWIKDGTVRYVWYDFPLPQLHKNAVLAARAGRCANEQNRFWEFHDHIFARQAEWSESNDAADLFAGYAEAVNIDRGAFAGCLGSDKYLKEVSESSAFGETLGVGGTPTLFVNGKKVTNIPSTRAEWQQLIEQERGGAAAPAAAPAAGAAPAAAPAAGAVPAATDSAAG
ncbi:thioredoxin domain-containing protein [Longimicrobium terrae]|uniref:Protein-disulfide isomerase n=1 Tax=Longimicrobium terrae TaxID=1639882 RepID=A0A841GXM9_9BACT|nr:protein-disulfide isomerase [Longimicrobium terrae]MBB6070510.1 protein-disulfide isomerase [Longimicrobium terrae]NNC29500.1 DsbA family protein [Longimicrobium terrae]